MSGMTIRKKVKLGTGDKGAKKVRKREGESQSEMKFPGRLPRITKLMALAIKFDQMLRDGVVKNQSELAVLGHVTRARVTQIMNLLNLAPDIQETILYLSRVESGRNPVTERDLRAVVAEIGWERQRELWARCWPSFNSPID